MGARLSLLAPSAPTVAISSYIDVLSNFQYVELINNSRFLKTIKAIDKATGNFIIIKVLIKPSINTSNYNIRLSEVTELLATQASLLSQLNNIIPWHQLIETDRAGYLIRQMVKTNLYDRLSLRPFLEPIEKAFLVFQMLKIIHELHDLCIHHGDLKLENFLVTSWNWLMLADFANFTKPTFIPEDNPNQYSFYYDSSDRRVCYIAPERFFNSKKTSNLTQNINDEGKYSGKDGITNEMDLFSLGCSVVELYSDGEPTFTLSQLFKFMKNEYTPDLSTIKDDSIREIAKSLIQLDHVKRPSAQHILDTYRSKCFPDFFYEFLFDFMSYMNNNNNFVVPADGTNVSINDLKIEKIYDDYEKISKALGLQYKELPNGTSPDSILKMKFPGMNEDCSTQPSQFLKEEELKEATLIILGLVFSMMRSLKKVSSKIKACELIVALSETISDECKLDRSLPYLSSLLDEYIDISKLEQQQNPILSSPTANFSSSSKVVCVALTSITKLLSTCKYITPIDVPMFLEYLLPKLVALSMLKISDSELTSIKVTLARCLPHLAGISKNFWQMSKSFKSDDLKEYTGIVKTSSADKGLLNTQNTFSIPKEQLDEEFQDLTLTLLTDKNPLVKISLLNNILPLCEFFGVDKTNDIILPHMISYLNDSNYQLRLAFLSSVLQIGPFVGVLAFEQYILPLLIQALGDLEQFVVLKVLEIFNSFVKSKLINPKTEFNALEVYKELLANSINLLLHPNEWIRQSVLCLIVSISNNITDADRYCFLYPIIKGFLSYDLSKITWNTLYPCVTKALSRKVYELAIVWSLNATKKSLFWQQKNFSTINDLNNNSKRKLVSFSKNMGKSVYLPKLNSDVNFSLSNGNISSVPLSPEDKQWLIKLKSIGLEDRDLWKVFILRDYIYHVSRSVNSKYNGAATTSQDEVDFNNVSNVINITPRNIFFDVCYKSEPLATGSRMTESSIEASLNPGDSVSLHDIESKKGFQSLILPNLSKFKASVQIVQANVFGEMELSNESSGNTHRHKHQHATNDSNSAHRVYSVNDSKIITANIKHSYSGNNPFIISYLNNVEFDPQLNDFPEFGHTIKLSKPSSLDTGEKVAWKPKGILVARINSNNNVGGEIDSVNCVEVCLTSEFFVTGSELGILKVWDTTKMEKVVTVKNSSLSMNLNSPITCIKFLKDRFVIGVTTLDGVVRLFKIEVARGKNKKIVKYSKLKLIRKYDLDTQSEGYILKCQFVEQPTQHLLVGISSTSKIIAFGIIRMERVFDVQNPLSLGVPTTFIVGGTLVWLLVGTDKGILCLWDLRFRVLVKSWRVELEGSETHKPSMIKKLILLPHDYSLDGNQDTEVSHFAMIGGSQESDISIWEVPCFECKQVLSSQVPSPYVKKYSLKEINVDPFKIDLKEMLMDFNFEETSEDTGPEDKSFTALSYHRETGNSSGYFLSSTWDQRLILWNLNNFSDSTSLNNQYETEFISKTFNYQTRTLVSETFNSAKVVPKVPKKSIEYKLDELAAEQLDIFKKHQDLITDLDIITKPFEMVVSGDRSGYINIYK